MGKGQVEEALGDRETDIRDVGFSTAVTTARRVRQSSGVLSLG